MDANCLMPHVYHDSTEESSYDTEDEMTVRAMIVSD